VTDKSVSLWHDKLLLGDDDTLFDTPKIKNHSINEKNLYEEQKILSEAVRKSAKIQTYNVIFQS
jgi:hypothetical protein